MNTRKWLAECHAWLDDPTSVQWEEQVAIGTWHLGSSGFGPVNNSTYNWRIKPKTITINGTELPKPVPELTTCWSLSLKGADEDRSKVFWFNTREDRDAVYAKLVEILS